MKLNGTVRRSSQSCGAAAVPFTELDARPSRASTTSTAAWVKKDAVTLPGGENPAPNEKGRLREQSAPIVRQRHGRPHDMTGIDSTADPETNQLVLHVERPMPGIRDWTVWCGVPGTNPVTHEDGLLVGYGSTAEGALAHAKVRLTQVLATLEAKYRAGALAADMRAWERNEFDLGSHERFCGGGH